MFIKFLVLIFLSSAFASISLSPEQLKISNQIVEALQSGDESAYKKLIHSKCTLDESRIKSSTQNQWTKRYQVRVKTLTESFDLAQTKFEVMPDYILEFQVWTKVSDPKLIKLMKGVTEIETVKIFPIAKEGTEMKILEWPCFGPK